MMYIARQGYFAATGEEFPLGAVTFRHPYLKLEDFWDFDDRAEMARRLPRLTALCWPSP